MKNQPPLKGGESIGDMYLSKQEKIYQKGYNSMIKELDIINIIKSIHKLKAGLSAVIKDDDEMIKESR